MVPTTKNEIDAKPDETDQRDGRCSRQYPLHRTAPKRHFGYCGAPVRRFAQSGLCADTSLVAPALPLVRNLFCVGWNYVDHFAEGAAVRGASGAQEIPDRPTFFTKATGTV